MIRQNLHTHTLYDDGKNTPEEMARAALAAGLTSLGFSGHSVLSYENDWSMTERSMEEYLEDVRRVKIAFAGRLEIFLGLEWDLLSDPPENFDYIIGSIHHLKGTPPGFTVDDSPAVTRAAISRDFGGSAEAMAQAYFSQYEALAALPFVDIVGHFDLLTKYDEAYRIFNADAPVFQDAAMAALELLCRADKIFEVNTGAVARGWRTAPYPSRRLLRELKVRGARVLVNSDTHSVETVAFAFPEAEALLRDVGFREIWELSEDGFRPVPLTG